MLAPSFWLKWSLLFNVLALLIAVWAVYRLGGVRYTWQQLRTNSVPAMYQHALDFHTRMAKSEDGNSNTIVLIGDSITEFGQWSELLSGSTDAKILNRGIAGDQVQGLRARIKTIVPLQPKKLFLLIGVNDLFARKAAAVIPDYQLLVNEIQTALPTTELVLQTVFPVNNGVRSVGIENAEIDLLNAAIRQLAKQKSLPLLDISDSFRMPSRRDLDPIYTSDGIHLNGEGYIKWATAIDLFLKDPL